MGDISLLAQTKRWLLKPSGEAEARRQAEAKAQREFQARQQAEARAQQAESELVRLKTLLERLRTDDE